MGDLSVASSVGAELYILALFPFRYTPSSFYSIFTSAQVSKVITLPLKQKPDVESRLPRQMLLKVPAKFQVNLGLRVSFM